MLQQVRHFKALINRLNHLPEAELLIEPLVLDQRRRLLLKVLTATPGTERCRRRLKDELVRRGGTLQSAEQFVANVIYRLKSKAGCSSQMLKLVRDICTCYAATPII